MSLPLLSCQTKPNQNEAFQDFLATKRKGIEFEFEFGNTFTVNSWMDLWERHDCVAPISIAPRRMVIYREQQPVLVVMNKFINLGLSLDWMRAELAWAGRRFILPTNQPTTTVWRREQFQDSFFLITITTLNLKQSFYFLFKKKN